MKKCAIIMLTTLLFTATPAWAQWSQNVLQGSFSGLRNNERYVVSINKFNGSARIDVFFNDADKQVSQYILQDGILWHLALYSPDLKWQVTDFAEIVADLKGGAAPLPVSADFKDTGRTVEHAGYTGRVYEVTDNHANESYEIWLTDDLEVWALSSILIMLYSDPRAEIGRRNILEYINIQEKRISNTIGFYLCISNTGVSITPELGYMEDLRKKASSENLQFAPYGIISFKDAIKLQKVEYVTLTDDFFNLPGTTAE